MVRAKSATHCGCDCCVTGCLVWERDLWTHRAGSRVLRAARAYPDAGGGREPQPGWCTPNPSSRWSSSCRQAVAGGVVLSELWRQRAQVQLASDHPVAIGCYCAGPRNRCAELLPDISRTRSVGRCHVERPGRRRVKQPRSLVTNVCCLLPISFSLLLRFTNLRVGSVPHIVIRNRVDERQFHRT